jgi:uncharacterized protein
MKAFVISICLALTTLVWVALASAQQQPVSDQPLMGSEATPNPAPLETQGPVDPGLADGTFRILVVGDNLAGGLGAGMTRMALDDPRYEIINRFNEQSGLARTEFYDWPGAIEKIVADKPVNAVVVLLGVNDRQDIRNGNTRYAFKSPDWIKGYEANIDRLLNAVKAADAVAIWVSIPPMQDASFDADMRYLSDIQAKRVAAMGGVYVDVRPSFLAADGSYVDHGPDETGADRKLRSRDGITFYKQGNNRFGQLVMAKVNALASTGQSGPAPVAATIAPKTAAPATEPAGVTVVTEAPSFGQDGLDGEQITFKADAIAAAAPPAKSVAQRTTVANAAPSPDVKIVAKAGSQAQRLLVDGILPVAPTGRFDDYTVPAAP